MDSSFALAVKELPSQNFVLVVGLWFRAYTMQYIF